MSRLSATIEATHFFSQSLLCVRDFADGLEEVVVIEEKRRFMESRVRDALYDLPDGRRPRVVGRHDGEGKEMLPGCGEFGAEEIARAMATQPRLLLLDEPVAGMNPMETAELTQLIGKLRTEWGFTIVMIEHDMRVVRDVSDRVVVLDHGIPIAHGSYDEVSTNPDVIEAYLGRPAERHA